MVVTDRRQARAPLPEVVAAAVAGGARWVLLREKDLPYAERVALADELGRVLASAGGRLIVAGPDPLGGDAVHLAAADPYPPDTGGQRGQGLLVGRSCHDAPELDRLSIEDYATVSPVYASASKPGYGPGLGLDGLRALCRRTSRPVLALGGVATVAQVEECAAAGAAGVAVMGAVNRATDPGSVVEALVRAWNWRQEAA
jgi:thiamine-phosphate pyrophosphorylase